MLVWLVLRKKIHDVKGGSSPLQCLSPPLRIAFCHFQGVGKSYFFVNCFCARYNPTVNAIIVSPFFSSQGGVAECKAVHNMGVLMDAYFRAGNMVAC